MIERLDQLSLQRLIELACGDVNVLADPHEEVTRENLIKRANSILQEFKAIAMPTSAKIDMLDAEDESKLHMKEKCVRVCMLLCSQKKHDYAKEVLAELDVDVTPLDTNEKVEKKCKAMLNDVVYELEHFEKRNNGESKDTDATSIRNAWHKEIAWVMSVFKMSIDVNTINAAIYANLVNQAVQRSKQLAKMPPMSRFMF